MPRKPATPQRLFGDVVRAERNRQGISQEELAQLLGASRQRVNQELKTMEREQSIRIDPAGLVVRDRDALMRIADADR